MTATRLHASRATFHARARRTPIAVAVGLALAAGIPAVHAAAPAPGAALDPADFVVNTHTPGDQARAAVARDAAGDFVIVWQSYSQAATASNYDIYAQRYHADGSLNGTEFLVNTTTDDDQGDPTVAMDAAGDFVVAWDGPNGAGGYGIYTRLFASDGTPAGGEIHVDSFNGAAADESGTRVAMDAAGDFAITWVDYGPGYYDGDGNGIFARRFQADGSAIDPNEIQVNTVAAGDQISAAIAMDAAGDFIVAWRDNDTHNIDARQFTLTGDPDATTAFQVNTNTFSNGYAYVGMDARGDFVVGWDAYYYASAGATERTYNLYLRRYTKQGVALDAADVKFFSETGSRPFVLGVAMDAVGDFVVEAATYDDRDGDGAGMFGQLYKADGTALTSLFQINTTTAGDQEYPAGVAMDASGDFVMAWSDYDGNDGDAAGVFARRFAGPQLTDLAATLTASTDDITAGDTFSVTATVENAVTPTGFAQIDANAALASGIALTVTLPKGASFGDATGADWTCDAPGAGKLACDYSGALGIGAKAPLKLNFTAPSSAGDLAFTATVSADQTDTAADNDSATATVTVKAAPADTTGGDDTGGTSAPPMSSSSSGGGGGLGFLGLLALGLPLARKRRDS